MGALGLAEKAAQQKQERRCTHAPAREGCAALSMASDLLPWLEIGQRHREAVRQDVWRSRRERGER